MKRDREQEGPHEDDTLATSAGHHANGASTTNFRNVSACNRCRSRKNRCDQKLPRCTGCEKAKVQCVGFDPVSKRQIPRSYVYYLETRVNSLEGILQAHGIAHPPPSEDFSISDVIKPGVNVPFPPQDEDGPPARSARPPTEGAGGDAVDPDLEGPVDQEQLNKLAKNISMVSVQGMSDPRQHGAGGTIGIPFAKVVYAAVKSSVAQPQNERPGQRPTKSLPSAPATSSGSNGADTFFGLNTRPAIKPAPFPDEKTGMNLIKLYFEYANPQMPILHRGEFMTLAHRVFAADPKKRKPRELYLMNIVFAIGSGIIMNTSKSDGVAPNPDYDDEDSPPNAKRARTGKPQYQPEEYHSSAIGHLDSFLVSAPATDSAGGGLEELQAVLLLAGLALLRPVAPGLWYIIGVAVRLAIDLGLHCEDVDGQLDTEPGFADGGDAAAKSFGKKQWARDLRRRLWWCVYSFDRLVSTCVGRPVGFTDQVVTTEFPSLLDDDYIKPTGFTKPPNQVEMPSYKLVAHHYFRLRLLQSEILQVLAWGQTEHARATCTNPFMNTDLLNPFLHKFRSFRDWRADVDRRLWEWRESAPKQTCTGVAFTPLFLELNYWQAVISLYRQSLAVPAPLAGEASPSMAQGMRSPGAGSMEAKEDEEMVFMKVAQAGQTVLKIYRQLHRLKLVNYTFLATHHLFMSGISFLYAIWHSTLVRSQLTLDDVDFTVLIATSVLGDLSDKCPPADSCREAFVRMSKATISMVMSTTGFGNASTLGSQPLNSPEGSSYFRNLCTPHHSPGSLQTQPATQMPQFDMNLKELFSDEELANRTPHFSYPSITMPQDSETSSPAYSTMPNYSSPKQGNAFARPAMQATPGAPQYQQQQQQPQPQSPASRQYPMTNAQQYQPITETILRGQPDFAFGDLDFLDTLPASDQPALGWGNPGEFDLGFGTGGTAYDPNGSWDPSGGLDLFDGFFFGNSGNGL
ncbi:hypothetical protein KC349_g3586 [Hortaea werneckii]|nr:hypothetical protein KC349_g3586 [Hortaea werneckii]